MTNPTESLIGQIRQAAETGNLPDGDSVNVSTQMWLEDLIRQHEAYMGEGATGNDAQGASAKAIPPFTSPANTSEILEKPVSIIDIQKHLCAAEETFSDRMIKAVLGAAGVKYVD